VKYLWLVSRLMCARSCRLRSASAAHRLCLPDTASSRAGLDVFAGCIRRVARQRVARDLAPCTDPSHHGAFAPGPCATVDRGAHASLVAERRSCAFGAARRGHAGARARAPALESAIPREASATCSPWVRPVRSSLRRLCVAARCSRSWRAGLRRKVARRAGRHRALESARYAFYQRRGYLE